MNDEDTLIIKKKDPDWYISNVHCLRGIEYLRTKLIEDGYISSGVGKREWELMWEESLEQTTAINEPSPLGPDPEQAKKFLMAQIEARVSRLEERADNSEQGIITLSDWLLRNQTHYLWPQHQKVEKILYGAPAQTTSETRPDTAP